jgi:hypothetical protein
MSQLLINKNTQRPSKMTVGILPLAGDPVGASFHEATVWRRSTRMSSTNLLYLRDRHMSPKLRSRVVERFASETDPRELVSSAYAMLSLVRNAPCFSR